MSILSFFKSYFKSEEKVVQKPVRKPASKMLAEFGIRSYFFKPIPDEEVEGIRIRLKNEIDKLKESIEKSFLLEHVLVQEVEKQISELEDRVKCLELNNYSRFDKGVFERSCDFTDLREGSFSRNRIIKSPLVFLFPIMDITHEKSWIKVLDGVSTRISVPYNFGFMRFSLGDRCSFRSKISELVKTKYRQKYLEAGNLMDHYFVAGLVIEYDPYSFSSSFTNSLCVDIKTSDYVLVGCKYNNLFLIHD